MHHFIKAYAQEGSAVFGVLAAIVVLIDAKRKQRSEHIDPGHLRKAQAIALILVANIFALLPKTDLTFAAQTSIFVVSIALFCYGMILTRRATRNAGK